MAGLADRIRFARQLPREVLARRLAEFASRNLRKGGRLILEHCRTTYRSPNGRRSTTAQVAISAADIPSDLVRTLEALGQGYLEHRFDILGSGPVAAAYGLVAEGFLSHRYAAPEWERAPRPDGSGLGDIVNRANLARSQATWQRIDHTTYTPINWHTDLRSGFRWSARRHSYLQPIPVDQGADVKVPWELGRLQHLPQLALCALLGRAKRGSFAPAERYVDEIKNELLDFIAANPPRFGVNWVCAMDVAIRAANISMTLAVLSGAGISLLPQDEQIIIDSLHDHAEHVVTHLEYADVGRSNHYLANIAGLLWTAWALSGEAANRWMAFAVAQIVEEFDNQFLGDGGNYEGSTSYHRLSGEMATFCFALILSLDEAALRRLQSATPPRSGWRVPFPAAALQGCAAKGAAALISASAAGKLRRAADLSRSVQGSDGAIVQIGDTDSGRFFKLHPVSASTSSFVENHLDHTGFIEAVDAVFGQNGKAHRLDAIVVQKLARQHLTAEPPLKLQDFGDLASLTSAAGNLPPASARCRTLRYGRRLEPAGWSRFAFPDFGLYVFKHQEGDLLAFRCAASPPPSAPRGHMHDDNLAIEYRFAQDSRRDPGSFVYTPSVTIRNSYRAAAVHDVARVRHAPIAQPGRDLFDLGTRAFASCLAYRPDGVAGEIVGPWGSLKRIIQFAETHVSVWDCVDPPAELDDVSEPPRFSPGYGQR